MKNNAKIKNSFQEGITLIELLLVVAIVSILGAATTPFLSRFILQTNFDSSKERLIGSIRKAQGYAMDKKNGTAWGICKNANSIRIYRGTCASPAFSEDFDIPANVTVTGLSDTLFDVRGEPSAVSTVSISTTLESGSVVINASGGLTIN